MVEVRQTDVFVAWFEGAKGSRGAGSHHGTNPPPFARNPGYVKPVGQGVSEMRIDYGPGYRVYFVQRGEALVILLCGGDKRDQSRDIARALELAKEV